MLTLVLHTISTGAAVVALVLATAALKRKQLPRRRIERCELRADDLEQRVEQLHGQVRRQNARLAARERREREPERKPAIDDDLGTPTMPVAIRQPGETDLEFKRRVRALIAEGKVGHGR